MDVYGRFLGNDEPQRFCCAEKLTQYFRAIIFERSGDDLARAFPLTWQARRQRNRAFLLVTRFEDAAFAFKRRIEEAGDRLQHIFNRGIRIADL